MEGTGHVLYTITSKDVLPVSSLVTPLVVKTALIMAGCAHNTSGLLVIYFASNVFGSLFCSWPRRRKGRRRRSPWTIWQMEREGLSFENKSYFCGSILTPTIITQYCLTCFLINDSLGGKNSFKKYINGWMCTQYLWLTSNLLRFSFILKIISAGAMLKELANSHLTLSSLQERITFTALKECDAPCSQQSFPGL